MTDKNKPNYIKKYRRTNLLWLIFWVLIGIAIFVTGLAIWHTRANIFTVLGVLMVLPGAKRVVALVVAGKKKSVSIDRCSTIEREFDPYKYAYDVDTWKYETYDDEDTSDENTADKKILSKNNDSKYVSDEVTYPESVIFTDYIFTSPDKIMMCDFLIESRGNIYILPSADSDDFEYIKKYLTDGIRKACSSYHILFTSSDDELISKHKHESATDISYSDRRDVLAYLKSLAV